MSEGPSRLTRRRLLTSVPASAALALLPSRFALAEQAARPRIAIVGAGIVGTTLAYRLARRGASVTVIDPSPGQGCTQGSFAMLIAGHPDGPEHFNALYGHAVAEWHRLQTEVPGLPIQWGGVVNWAAPGENAQKLVREQARLASWGVGARLIGADDIDRLCPGVVVGSFGAGSFMPSQGAVDIAGVMAVLTRQAARLGVRFVRARVSDFSVQGGGTIVVTDSGPIAADHVALAAGAANTALAAKIGAHVPLELVSGTLAHSEPMRPVLHRVLNGPLGSVKQNPDGSIVTGLDYAPDAHSVDTSDAHGRALLATAARMVPALRGARLDKVTVGYVPIPAHDQMPIVGPLRAPGRVYVASMMSGVTMSPLMARLIAGEILDGRPSPLLTPYRPDRFNPQWAAHDGAVISARHLEPARL